MRKIILFDIDRTLINTDELSLRHKQELREVLGISETEYNAARERYTKTLAHPHDFNPDDLLVSFSKLFNKDMKTLREAYEKPRIYIDSLYKETTSALQELAENHRLGIFSEGISSGQKSKLKLSGILKFFDPELVFIFRRKLNPISLNEVPVGAFIIDDKIEVVESLQKQGKFTPIFIDRLDTKEAVKHTISSLAELKNLLPTV